MIFLAAVLSARCASACARRSRRRCCRSSPTISSSFRRCTSSPSPSRRSSSRWSCSCRRRVVGWLAGRARDQERLARESARATRSLVELSRKLSGAVALDDILEAATRLRAEDARRARVVMLLPEDGELRHALAWPPLDALEPRRDRRGALGLREARGGGLATGTLPNMRFQFRPLVTARGVVGVCGFRRPSAIRRSRRRSSTRSTSMLDQTAIALDRALLVKATRCERRRWRRTRSCARRCSPRCRTICARRWPRSSARRRRCSSSATR